MLAQILLQAAEQGGAGLAVFGAAIGAGLAAIGAGLGIGKIGGKCNGRYRSSARSCWCNPNCNAYHRCSYRSGSFVCSGNLSSYLFQIVVRSGLTPVKRRL